MASLLSLPDGRLVFCNPNSPTDRVALTVRTSTDGGMTWNDGLLIDSRPSAYSCLTSLRDGRLGVIYETGDSDSNETLTFSSFALP
jgi:sialidase-1